MNIYYTVFYIYDYTIKYKTYKSKIQKSIKGEKIMNVIKRDGRIVDYNRAKIIIAIQKANEEVKPKEKITSKQIEEIADVVEASKKKNYFFNIFRISASLSNAAFNVSSFFAKWNRMYWFTSSLKKLEPGTAPTPTFSARSTQNS